tara:strand:+ start:2343 stop:2972 length:630 start_codon:yes stop_codon:yes gene_type:complete
MKLRIPFFSSTKKQEADMKSFLIVGLGNIGVDYKGTRHNIGFDVVDALAKEKETSFETLRYGDVAKITNKGKTAYLLKPNTFMNRSGKAVRYWMQQKKIPKENLLIITDDIHLDFGFLRMRKKGSDGGHNGLKDICAQLNSSGYTRLRFGIGADFNKGRQVDFVLQPWNTDEVKTLPFAIEKATQAIWCFMAEDAVAAMNKFNGNTLEL